MSVKVLMDLKIALEANSAINAFFIAHYEKNLRHVVGYEKDSDNLGNKPLLCHVNGKTKHDKALINPVSQGLMMLQIIEPEEIDGVKQGVVIAEAATDLLLDFLKKQPIAKAFFYDFETATDLGTQHPFYEMGISFKYHYRRA